MMKVTDVASYVIAVAIQFSLVSLVCAADLSDGMKSLKLGITKEEALKVLENQELQQGKIFAPYCEPDDLGEMCTARSNLTYGNIPLLNWTINFGPDSRLARVGLLLSKRGCNGSGTEAMHPHSQFESLSALLERQYGKPTDRSGNVLVWLDTKLKVGLVLGLYSQPIAGIGYPGCPITSISLTSNDYMNKLNVPKSKESARQNDL